MKIIFPFILLIFLTSCSGSNPKETAEKLEPQESSNSEIDTNTSKSVMSTPCDKMDSLLSLMDSLKYADYSLENDELIWAYSSQVDLLATKCAKFMINNGTCQPENFNVCWSADSVIGILSWDTRMGGTFVNVEHVKFSKASTGAIFYKSIDREKKGDGDINATSYNQIAKLPISGKDIYICKGAGKTSNPTFYYSVDVVEITKKAIVPANIFPDAQSEKHVNYDMMEIYGDMKVLDIIVLPNGDIQIPEFKGYSQPTGNYITWKLRNGKYEELQPYEAFIPSGYEILEIKEGRIYPDGVDKNDIVMILRDTLELQEDIWELPRPLIVLKATKNGYELSARADHVVMCQDCGGVFGDPFEYLEISPETIEVGHYGGSSQRWYERYKFKLAEGGNNWELVETVSGGHSVFDEDGDGEVDEYEETTQTPFDFGVITMEDFGKE